MPVMTVPMNVRWLAGGSASALHAAEAVLHGKTLVERELSAALAPHVEALKVTAFEDILVPDDLLEHWIPLSARIHGNLELARTGLARIVERERAEQLAHKYRGLITELEHTLTGLRPQLEEELQRAIPPLREQWLAGAPLVFERIATLIEPDLIADEADVVLVMPVLGGGGKAHLPYNLVRIEAVPNDPEPRLPEGARLVWLLSTLNLDLPRYSERLRPGQAATTAALAMLPAVLAALNEDDFPACDEGLLSTALERWLGYGEHAAETAARLGDWWQVYCAQRPAWSSALEALEHVVAPSAEATSY